MTRGLTQKQISILKELSYRGVRSIDDLTPDQLKQIEQFQVYETLYLDINNFLNKRWENRQIEENY
jgi:hypothetical protein